ncbi:hypothetical protein Tsubulata_047639 [Turnera subulata]|uniref:Uncharacterized protein n=1 Tax=Turnera subulata TaxID=218843 RepID=A0A9Q0G9J1_9ROSI|nr:hypothetical protein Tsubulata_047639 [Turnera subulata]
MEKEVNLCLDTALPALLLYTRHEYELGEMIQVNYYSSGQVFYFLTFTAKNLATNMVLSCMYVTLENLGSILSLH